MPMPVSATAIMTYWPASTGSASAADIGLVEIAVRGLDRDLAAVRHGVAGVEGEIENARSRAGWGRHGCATARRPAPFPATRLRRASGAGTRRLPATSLLASIDLGASGCWREKASSRLVSVTARCTPCSAMSLARAIRVGRGRRLPSAGIWRPIMSRPPITIVSRLLKSCATPPVSWPTASIFCAWRSSSSALLARFVLGLQLARALLDRVLQRLGERPQLRPCARLRSVMSTLTPTTRSGAAVRVVEDDVARLHPFQFAVARADDAELGLRSRAPAPRTRSRSGWRCAARPRGRSHLSQVS